MATDEKSRMELEAAVFRRLVEHLRARTDVQNIDLDESRRLLPQLPVELDEGCRRRERRADDARTRVARLVYGMPYDEWRAKHQKEASPAQKGGLRKSKPKALTLCVCLARQRRSRPVQCCG